MARTDVTIISAQVPTATRLELVRRAQDNYRSISSEIRLALDEHLRAAPQPAGRKAADDAAA